MYTFLLATLAIIGSNNIHASESCFSLEACRTASHLGINCCYDKYKDQVCKADNGDYDDYLADSNRGADITKVLCSQPKGKMQALEFYDCYTRCGINEEIIKACQIGAFGGPINSEEIITKKVCNGKPQWITDYFGCLKNKYNKFYGATNGPVELKAQSIQVHFCQARVLGFIVDVQQMLKELLNGGETSL